MRLQKFQWPNGSYSSMEICMGGADILLVYVKPGEGCHDQVDEI